MTQTVYLVDDDHALRDSLAGLLTTHELDVKHFSSGEELLAACGPDARGCLLLDQRLPGISGTQLQQALAAQGVRMPIIFMTAYGDVPTSVHALKQGALDFIEKPVSSDALVEHVRAALALDERRNDERQRNTEARDRLGTLTPREHAVMELVVAGQASKEIARTLGISHRTVDVHRARVMRKTGAATLLELAELHREVAGATAPAPARADGDGSTAHSTGL